jgi:hypothetical protein
LGVSSDEFGELLVPLDNQKKAKLGELLRERVQLGRLRQGNVNYSLIRPQREQLIRTDTITADMVANPRKYLDEFLLHQNVYINESELRRTRGGDYIDQWQELEPEFAPQQYPDNRHQAIAEQQYDEAVSTGKSYAIPRHLQGIYRQ